MTASTLSTTGSSRPRLTRITVGMSSGEMKIGLGSGVGRAAAQTAASTMWVTTATCAAAWPARMASQECASGERGRGRTMVWCAIRRGCSRTRSVSLLSSASTDASVWGARAISSGWQVTHTTSAQGHMHNSCHLLRAVMRMGTQHVHHLAATSMCVCEIGCMSGVLASSNVLCLSI